MPRVIELVDKKIETLFNRQDFEYLLERYMGYEAVQYFRDVIEEIEDSYNEQIDELIVENEDLRDVIEEIEDSYNEQIDELIVQNEDLREKLENIREVCRE